MKRTPEEREALLIRVGQRDGGTAEGKQFFFEKKNQKTFALLVDVAGTISMNPLE